MNEINEKLEKLKMESCAKPISRFMRGVDSNKQAGPLCQRPDCKSSASAFVSIQREQAKGVPHIPINLRTRQRDTLDPRIARSTWTESPTWWSSSSWTIDGKKGTLMDGKTKNGEITDNLVNACVSHRQAQGNLCRDVKAMSQLLSSSPVSRFHL